MPFQTSAKIFVGAFFVLSLAKILFIFLKGLIL